VVGILRIGNRRQFEDIDHPQRVQPQCRIQLLQDGQIVAPDIVADNDGGAIRQRIEFRPASIGALNRA
jgi:hypothetical protein